MKFDFMCQEEFLDLSELNAVDSFELCFAIRGSFGR